MLYTLLQISDSLFPSGAFAHSGGLEGLVAQTSGFDSIGSGVAAGDVIQPILAELFTQHLVYCDGLLGVAAHRAHRRKDVAALCAVDSHLTAMKMARELREASASTGRSFLSEVTPLLQDDTLHAWQQQVEVGASPGNYSCAFHVAAAAAGVPERDASLAWAYQSLAQMIAALLRLGVLGHRRAQGLLAALRALVEQRVDDIVGQPAPLLSSFAPLLEIASMRHERQYSRLFRS